MLALFLTLLALVCFEVGILRYNSFLYFTMTNIL